MDNFHGILGNSDIYQLVNLLESLEKELKNPYSDSRPSDGKDFESQLKHALGEIKHRENDLIACIGIAKLLIKNNNLLSSKIQESEKFSQKIEYLSQDLLKMKEENHSLEDKILENNHTIHKLEDEVHHWKQQHSSVLREQIKNSTLERLGSISFERFSAEISNVKDHFREDYDKLMSDFYVEEKKEVEMVCNELTEKVLALEAIISVKQRNSELFRQASTDVESVLSNTPGRVSLKTVIDKGESESNDFYSELKSSPEVCATCNNSFISLAKNWEIVSLQSFLIESKPRFVQEFTEEIFFNMVRNI
jgi:hypothetical protein